MIEIPLSPLPSQSIQTNLSGQICQIYIYQKDQGLFIDLISNGNPIVNGIICQDANPIVCRSYAGFQGNLIFIYSQGNNDPEYSSLGSRYSLIYLDTSENALL